MFPCYSTHTLNNQDELLTNMYIIYTAKCCEIHSMSCTSCLTLGSVNFCLMQFLHIMYALTFFRLFCSIYIVDLLYFHCIWPDIILHSVIASRNCGFKVGLHLCCCTYIGKKCPIRCSTIVKLGLSLKTLIVIKKDSQ